MFPLKQVRHVSRTTLLPVGPPRASTVPTAGGVWFDGRQTAGLQMSKTNTPSLMTMRGPHDWVVVRRRHELGLSQSHSFRALRARQGDNSVMRLISCGWLSYEVKDGTSRGQPSDRLQAFIWNHLCPRRWLCIELTNFFFFLKGPILFNIIIFNIIQSLK